MSAVKYPICKKSSGQISVVKCPLSKFPVVKSPVEKSSTVELPAVKFPEYKNPNFKIPVVKITTAKFPSTLFIRQWSSRADCKSITCTQDSQTETTFCFQKTSPHYYFQFSEDPEGQTSN